MKRLLLLLIFSSSIYAFSQVPNYVPSNGLISYWPFNGNANDESGNGNDGTVNGATLTTDRFGNADNAYFFPGNCNVSIDAMVNTTSINGQLSFSIWVLREGSGCIGPRYFEAWPGSNSLGNFQLSWDNSFSYPQGVTHRVNGGNGPNGLTTASFDSVGNNVWTNIVYVNDGINAFLYQDGVLKSTGVNPVGSTITLASDIAIGRMNHPAFDAINGKVDDIGIWNRALTQQEISDLYNSRSPLCDSIASITPNDTSLCENDSISLNASFTSNQSLCVTSPVIYDGNDNFFLVSNTTDAAKNMYRTGSFNGSTTIGDTSFSTSASSEMFTVKYDSCGQFVWSIRSTSTGSVSPRDIVSDNQGNIYVCGGYNQSFSFTDIAGNITSFNHGGSGDGFLVKISPSGVINWSITLRGGGYDEWYRINIDNAGEVLLVGTFNGCCPAPDNTSIFANGSQIPIGTPSFRSGVVSKFTSNGTYQWHGVIYNRDASVTAVETDAVNNVYVSGHFRSWNIGDPSPFIDGNGSSLAINNPGIGRAFLAKFSPQGQIQWETDFGNNGDGVNNLITAQSMEYAADNNLWIVGEYTGPAITFNSVNGLPTNQPAATGQRSYVVGYSVNGDVVTSASYQYQTGQNTMLYAIENLGDTLYVGGYAEGSGLQNKDALVRKLDYGLNELDITTVGGPGDDVVYDIHQIGNSVNISGAVAAGATIEGITSNSDAGFLWTKDAVTTPRITYQWSTGDTTSSLVVSPSQTTTYSVSMSDGVTTCVDSVAISIIPIARDTVAAVSCDSFVWNGQIYNSNGFYTDSFVSSTGCDSIAYLDLTINQTQTSTETEVACDSFIWNGQVYNATGIYTETFTSVSGCDSVATLNLTLNQTQTSTETQVACDSFVWNGQVYNATGVYQDVFTSNTGCDSIATLNLTLNQTQTSTETHVACDSFVWNGQAYNSTGIYTDTVTLANGCDSLATLNLTITQAQTFTEIQLACDSFIWNGQTYNATGIYIDSFTSSNGCDSIAVLDFTIIEPPIVSINIDSPISCFGDSDAEIRAVVAGGVSPYLADWSIDGLGDFDDGIIQVNVGLGMYSVQIEDATGCRSNTASIDLLEPELITVFATSFPELEGSSMDITILGGSPPFTFDWNYDGVGDNDDPEDLVLVSPNTYSVTVTDANGCMALFTDSIVEGGYPTSIFYVEGLEVSLFPNPTSGVVNVFYQVSNNEDILLEITDIQGRLIQSKRLYDGGMIQFDLGHLPDGTYFARFSQRNLVKEVGILKVE